MFEHVDVGLLLGKSQMLEVKAIAGQLGVYFMTKFILWVCAG